MKVLTLLIFIFNLNIYVFAQNECKSEYIKSKDKKIAKWKEDTKYYPTGISFSSVRAPKKSEYNIFEEIVLEAAQSKLDNSQASKPPLLEDIYNAAYEKYSDIISYNKIQDLINYGFKSGSFCKGPGLEKPNGIKRFVLKELKKESKETAVNREPAVIDFDYLDPFRGEVPKEHSSPKNLNNNPVYEN